MRPCNRPIACRSPASRVSPRSDPQRGPSSALRHARRGLVTQHGADSRRVFSHELAEQDTSSRHLVPRPCGPNLMPRRCIEVHVQRRDGLAQDLGSPRSHNRMRTTWQSPEPGVKHCRHRHTEAGRHRGQSSAHASRCGIFSREHTPSSQRRPDHRSQTQLLRLVKRPVVQGRQVQRRAFDLIRDQRRATVQESKLRRRKVRYTKRAHLA